MLIKLYCNHRPVFGLPLFKVYDAFEMIAGAGENGEIDRGKDWNIMLDVHLFLFLNSILLKLIYILKWLVCSRWCERSSLLRK